MIKKVAHIGIPVKSIEEARNFYEEVLGLKVTGIKELKEPKAKTAFTPIGDSKINL
ncbi:VOC family protein, partial [Caldanaerobacter subterraneus]|uniref:VOC family protein n=1 Tax=Caldanaerobacter subterraneus TaxID=911092 RepID=UPI000617D962